MTTQKSAAESHSHEYGSIWRDVEFDPTFFAPMTGKLLERWHVYSLGLMQLMTEQDFLRVYGFAAGRVGEVRRYLNGEKLRLHEPEEPFYGRAQEIYSDALTVPIDYLVLLMGGLPDIPRNPRMVIKQLQNEKGIPIISDFTRWSWDRLRPDLGTELTYWLDGWLHQLGISLKRTR